MPYTLLSRRDNAGNGSPLSSGSPNAPVYIGGIVVCVLIALGLAIWLGLRYLRKRNRRKLEEKRGGAFLTVRGLVKQQEGLGNQTSPSQPDITIGAAFSKTEYESVVMPNRRPRVPPTRDDIIEAHRESGNFPKPFSFALKASHPVSPPVDKGDRSSIATTNPCISIFGASSQSDGRRQSVMSGPSSPNSTLGVGHSRTIHQIHDPVLPDELVVSKGERVTVMESFDDGWCLIGRENSIFAGTTKSLFAQKKPGTEADVELGVIPAWCFVPPTKGLRVERPVRSSSLGVTVQIESPAEGRNQVISWSNF